METSARTRNALLTAVGVLGAVVLVAVAARGSTSTGDSSTRKPSDALLDVLFTMYLVALVAGVVMFVYLLVLRRKVKAQTGKAPRKSLLEMIGTMFVLVTVALLLGRRLQDWERPPPIEPEVGDRAGRHAAGRDVDLSRRRPPTRPRSPGLRCS